MKIDEIRPAHYGGETDPYEPIKVIDAWGLGFNLGNVVKYIARLGKKDDPLKELLKARTYLEFEIRKQQGIKDQVLNPTPTPPPVGDILGWEYSRRDGFTESKVPDVGEYIKGEEGKEDPSLSPVLNPTKQAETSAPEDQDEDDFEGRSKLPRTGEISTPTREQFIAGADSTDSTDSTEYVVGDRDYRFSKKKLQQLADREVQVWYVNGSRDMVADIIKYAGLAMDSGIFISNKPDGMYYRRNRDGLSIIPWSHDKGIKYLTPEDFLI